MKPLPRPCLDCGALHTNRSRCSKHDRANRAQGYNVAYSDPLYRRNRRRLIDAHVADKGWICPGAPDLDHQPHPSTDLTADHVVPLAEGGSHSLDNLRVLCKSANSARNTRPGREGGR